jgi:formylglycine-generating enzyme required for sulfatase activity
VTLSRPFYAGRFEITQAQFATLMSTNPSVFRSGCPNRPVDNVSWDEATAFCRRLTENERAAGSLPAGWIFRLPSEAEWEYIARAGSTQRYFFGDDPTGADLPDHAWFLTSGQTFNVATKHPNPWGLFNVLGNVAEWCQDNSDLYPGGPIIDPPGPAASAYRVIRGGGFRDDAVHLRSACRWSEAEPSERFHNVGFRVVLAPSDPSPVPPIDLVRIEPGLFTLGSPPSEPGHDPVEGPAREVSITRAFSIGRYEVTQAEYQTVTGFNPSQDRRFAHQPVEQVSWEEADQFCRELTRRAASAGSLPDGYAYRLPTEAEWEFAARAGTTTPYSFGVVGETLRLEDHACFLSAPTCGVGSRLPNAWGLHDVHGNVSEWCHDWFGPYTETPGPDPTGPSAGAARVVRGGSWNDPTSDCRSATRFSLAPAQRSRAVGFRVVLGPLVMP